jgi:hypothetical protein
MSFPSNLLPNSAAPERILDARKVWAKARATDPMAYKPHASTLELVLNSQSGITFQDIISDPTRNQKIAIFWAQLCANPAILECGVSYNGYPCTFEGVSPTSVRQELQMDCRIRAGFAIPTTYYNNLETVESQFRIGYRSVQKALAEKLSDALLKSINDHVGANSLADYPGEFMGTYDAATKISTFPYKNAAPALLADYFTNNEDLNLMESGSRILSGALFAASKYIDSMKNKYDFDGNRTGYKDIRAFLKAGLKDMAYLIADGSIAFASTTKYDKGDYAKIADMANIAEGRYSTTGVLEDFPQIGLDVVQRTMNGVNYLVVQAAPILPLENEVACLLVKV